MPQLFRRRKNRVVQKTWNGTGKSAVSSLVRISTNTQLPFAVCLARIRAHGWDPLVPTATGVYDGPQGTPRYFIVRGEYQGHNLLAWIGWACVVRREQWLAWINDWAPHHGSVDGNVRPVVHQGFDLFLKDTPLQSVKRCDMLPLISGSSCERGKKCALKALLPVLVVGHSFLN
jgi:hypothetical protein